VETTTDTSDRALWRVRQAGEGWRQIAVIVGVISCLGGGAVGYSLGLDCGPGPIGGTYCSPSDTAVLYVAAGALAGVIPALPLLAIGQLYRHLADLEQARTQT
jgi:hypothetical protein